MDSQRKNIDQFTFVYSDQLGEGSFGKVYKGKDTQTGGFVAVKMLDKRMITADEYLMEGLHNEIEVMKTLKSNFIVNLIDVLETSNNYYIVQEYCNGGDLRGYMKKKKIIPQKEATKILADMLGGFMELISHGIIHRDLKPENILIHNDMHKLADFGFAQSVDNFQKGLLTSQVGTPLYMSPQILKHEKYTTKSDIWSLGQIYYELLTGDTPWPNVRSQWELIQKINENKVVFPSNVPISMEAKDFILKTLEIQEKDRISWEGIYLHPLLKSYFSQYKGKLQKLENKAIFLINELRHQIYTNHTDLETVFAQYDKNNSKEISTKEFRELLREIDAALTNEEIEHLFNQLDEDNSGVIQFAEFKKWLEDNNVKMTKQGPPGKSAFQQYDTSDELPVLNHQNTDDRADQAIKALQVSIDYHKLNLKEVFDHFDKDKTGTLGMLQFSHLLQQIDQNLDDNDIRAAFTRFDADFSGFISYNQFCSILHPPTVYNPPPMNFSTHNQYQNPNYVPAPAPAPGYPQQYLNNPQPNYNTGNYYNPPTNQNYPYPPNNQPYVKENNMSKTQLKTLFF